MAVEAAAIEVTLPAMGESVTEGTILEWHKQEGDTIEADETLVEISTDEVDAEVPAPVSGTIVKIHFAEGDTVHVGSVLAEIAAGDGSAGATSSNGNGSGASAPEAPAAESAAGEIVDIVTPAGGESVTEGTILEWSVKVGDAVNDGDTVVEISTDKVDMELPAPTSGTITDILFDEGDTVTVGQVIARMQVGAGAAKPAPAQPSGNGAPAKAPAPLVGAISASSWPTVTVSPSATCSFTSVPAPGEGTSASILSVEISTRGSSAAISSPSCLYQERTVPSVTDSPIWGMTTWIVVFTAIEAGL